MQIRATIKNILFYVSSQHDLDSYQIKTLFFRNNYMYCKFKELNGSNQHSEPKCTGRNFDKP